MPSLTTLTNEPVHAAQPHSVLVRVNAGPAAATVSVTLQQTQGKQPFIALQTKQATVGMTGDAYVLFTIALAGPTPFATLLSTATDTAGTVYTPGAQSVEVEP